VERRAGVAWVTGVPVDDVTMDEAVDRIFDLVRDGRASGRCHQVATVNVDFVVNARHDPALRSVLHRTSLSIPDGMPIIWGSRLLGTPLRTRVAGADLVGALVARAAADGAVVSLFGAGPGIAPRAADVLRRAHPAATVVADEGPVFGDVAELSMDRLQGLRELRPDICCVAFGNPKQERFIERFGAELGIPVMIGIGGALDFIVGEKRRAPAWMQRSGLEWLHRAASEPRRLAGRYARDAVSFGPALVSQAWRGRPATGAPANAVHVEDGDEDVVHLNGDRSADNIVAAELAAALRSAWRHGRRPAVRCTSPASLSKVVGLAELAGAAPPPHSTHSTVAMPSQWGVAPAALSPGSPPGLATIPASVSAALPA
jgi:exopolysaccharide biosynthesis WecB/TagA/CpsF family protein